MKKIFLVLGILSVFLLTGCNSLDEKEIRDNFIKNVDKMKGYYLEGELSLTNNDDTYNYNVEVSYKADDKYKVVLINKANNYEQIILRNDDGVYVINPALNKSFKFQSDWPYNNSQAYLLNSLRNDLESDETFQFTQKDKDYIFTTKVNYPNNPNYVKQDITIDDKYNLKKVQVMDANGISFITFDVTSIDSNATFDDKYFDIDENIEKLDISENNQSNNNETDNNDSTNNNTDNDSKEQETNESTTNDENTESSTEETMEIDETLFPLYLPNNTTLSNKEVINKENGQRIIMTFQGEKPFILVEETVTKEDEHTIVPTYGEPFLLIDTVGSLTDISYTWTSNGIEYYIVSDVMDQEELLEVAKSINVVAAINEK